MAKQGDGFDVKRAYQILGVSPGASQVEIKDAYRQLVKIWHPDRFTTETEKLTAEEKIKEINAAYQALKLQAVAEQPAANSKQDQEKNRSYSQGTQVHVRSSVSAAEFYYRQGTELVQSGEYEEAIAFFSKAIQANPYYIEAYKYRGLLCSQLGLEIRATADLTKAAELEWHFRGKKRKTPTSPQVRVGRNRNRDRVQYKSKTTYSQRSMRRKSPSICQRIKYWWLRLRANF